MNKPSNKPSTLLFIILFGSMLIFGYIENIKGVSYPLIKAEFGISYEQQGMMVSSLSFSYVLFCLVGGILLGSLGVKKTFNMSFVFMIAGLAGAFFMPSFLSAASALFLVFAGFGLLEVSLNALAAQLFTVRAALLMNLLHFFYGVGSSLSPRIAGALAANQGWRLVYLLSLPLALIFFVPSVFARFPEVKEGQDGTGDAGAENNFSGNKKANFLTALMTPIVWIFSLALGLMVAVELCSGNWAGLYFQDVYNLDPKTQGAAFISNFYIFFTISRLLGGFAIEKIGYLRSLFICGLAVIFIFFLGFILGAKGLYVLPGLGFFTALFWPTLMAMAIGYFRKDAPVMTSAIVVIGGAFNAGIQFLIGLTNRLIGPAWGYRSGFFYAVLVIAALVVLARCMRRPYKTASK
jgi:fucose permease